MAQTANASGSRAVPPLPPTPWALSTSLSTLQSFSKENSGRGGGRQALSTKSSGKASLKGAYAVQKFVEIFQDARVDSDRLTPVRQLGAGAFARVTLYSLEDENHAGEKKEVAVKELREDFFEQEKDVISFFHETQLLRKLVHPSIVTFMGVSHGDLSGEQDDKLAISIVQEHMTCGSLKDIILEAMKYPKKQVYTKKEALEWLLQIAKGLMYLHELKSPIIHRDLKIENILLTDDGTGRRNAKLADFGLSAMVKRKDSSGTQRGSSGLLSSRTSYASGAGSVSMRSSSLAGNIRRAGSNLMKHISVSRLPEVFDDLDFNSSAARGNQGSAKYADTVAQFKNPPSSVRE